MIIRYFFILIASLAIVQAQAQSPALSNYFKENNIAPKQAYDLYYQIDRPSKGDTPKKGDYIMLNFTAKLLDGTVYEASEENDPFVFQVGYNQVIRGWDLGVTLFPVGSQGTLFIPPSLGYGKRGAGQTIPPNADLQIEMDILKILSQSEYNMYMKELEQKEQAAYQAKIEAQFVKDKKIIQDYALSNKLRTKRTKSGLSYVITKKGKGSIAQEGDELEVQYEGFLTDGSSFDKTKNQDTFTFQLGKGRVIDGWDEGLQYFNEGSEGLLLIPSALAYGPRPIYEEGVTVPANSVLIFKIKLLKIKKEQ